MQNRLATAILMGMGGSLANLEKSGEVSDEVSKKFLEAMSNYTVRLLRGEVVITKGDYPPLHLTGLNDAASSYNDVAKNFLDVSEGVVDYEVEGYKE